MNDLIKRQGAINVLLEKRSLFCDNTPESFNCLSHDEKCRVDEIDSCIAELVNLPSAESEYKMGEWVVIFKPEDCCYAKCNQCNVTQVFYHNKPLTNFCPNCGADMRGDSDD